MKYVAFSCFVLICALASARGNNAGPVGELDIFYISPCDPAVDNDIIVHSELKKGNDDRMALDMKFNLAEALDENAEFLLVADKWENGAWQEEAYKKDGKLFEFIDQYVPQIWANLREIVKPPIEAKDYIEPGEYSMDGYQDLAENMDLPQILYGRFRATVSFFNGRGDLMGCRLAEAESIPKM